MTPIFFIGSHRTGSKTIANFFRSNFPGAISHHQFATLRFVNVFSNMYLAKVISENMFEKFVQMFVVNRIKKQQCSFYIEANGFNFLAAHYAKKHFPDTKVVQVIRDPRDFVTSYLNWTHGRWQSRVARNYVPFWDVAGDQIGEISKKNWVRMDEFERYCWYWTFKNQKILDLYQDDRKNFVTVRFEDLIQPETRANSVKQILSFIGLGYQDQCEKYFDQKQNQSQVKFFPEWRQWGQRECQILNQHCHGLMEQFDYGQEDVWRAKVRGEACLNNSK